MITVYVFLSLFQAVLICIMCHKHNAFLRPLAWASALFYSIAKIARSRKKTCKVQRSQAHPLVCHCLFRDNMLQGFAGHKVQKDFVSLNSLSVLPVSLMKVFAEINWSKTNIKDRYETAALSGRLTSGSGLAIMNIKIKRYCDFFVVLEFFNSTINMNTNVIKKPLSLNWHSYYLQNFWSIYWQFGGRYDRPCWLCHNFDKTGIVSLALSTLIHDTDNSYIVLQLGNRNNSGQLLSLILLWS